MEYSPRTGPIDVICQGSPREMGRAQGAGLRARIAGARDSLAQLEGFRLAQPRWLPYRAFRRLAERKATRLMAGLAREQPQMHQRILGLAEGSGLSLHSVYLLNALDALMSTVRGRLVAPPPGACSAVAIRGSRSANGETVVARNFDYLPLVQPFYAIRDSRPQGAVRSLDFTVAPLVGAVDGINEHGLTITYNYAFTVDEPVATTPISMAIAEALGRCRTVEEAAEQIAGRGRWGSGILMLADAQGDIASLELSNTRSGLRRPEGGADVLYHTNAFQSPAMRGVQVADDAAFNHRAPTPLRGRRVLDSSERRGGRLAELLAGEGRLSADDLAQVMSDHGPQGEPGDATLCVHGSYWHTTATIQYFPRQRRMRLAYATTCAAEYQDLAL